MSVYNSNTLKRSYCNLIKRCLLYTSHEVGIVVRAYQRYEYGQREPQLAVLIRMADFYGVSLDYLVGRSDVRGRDAP